MCPHESVPDAYLVVDVEGSVGLKPDLFTRHEAELERMILRQDHDLLQTNETGIAHTDNGRNDKIRLGLFGQVQMSRHMFAPLAEETDCVSCTNQCGWNKTRKVCKQYCIAGLSALTSTGRPTPVIKPCYGGVSLCREWRKQMPRQIYSDRGLAQATGRRNSHADKILTNVLFGGLDVNRCKIIFLTGVR